uniref:Uncharacterized protein n=1 Tax=Anguilla anguilla TaxID=7936 RepID=A0A0E9U7E4_ANGAN
MHSLDKTGYFSKDTVALPQSTIPK